MSDRPRRRWLCPERIQSSSMDCGPVSLLSALDGFGLRSDAEHVREICRVSIDGSSIDDLEEVARRFGLEAEQVMVPLDHFLLRAAGNIPSIVVTRNPAGLTHFVVAWRRHGAFVQVMDPERGRRWPSTRRFLDEVYRHTMEVPRPDWLEWVRGEEYARGLRARLAAIGMPGSSVSSFLGRNDDPEGQGIILIDTALRMVQDLIEAKAIRHGAEAVRLLDRLTLDGSASIPPVFRAFGPGDSSDTLRFQGVVLIRLRRQLSNVTADSTHSASPVEPRASAEASLDAAHKQSDPARESWNLARERSDSARGAASDWKGAIRPKRGRDHPLLEVVQFLRGELAREGRLVVLAVCLLGLGSVGLAVLLRAFLEVAPRLALPWERGLALSAIVALSLILLLFDLWLGATALRWGRALELRVRTALARKLGHLGDSYFQTRLASDLMERAHRVNTLRDLPELFGQLARTIVILVLTTLGVCWLDPPHAPLALLAGIAAVALPLVFHPVLSERDLRFRAHNGALVRTYLDALLGLTAVRAHGGEHSLARDHEARLSEWGHAGFQLQRAALLAQLITGVCGVLLVSSILIARIERDDAGLGSVLLLVYWALQLPALGDRVAFLLRLLPQQRSVLVRLLEPLRAEDDRGVDPGQLRREPNATNQGVHIRLESVTVRIGGQALLEDVSLEIPAGREIAVVGPSGAGKSTLIALLLGLHHPDRGQVRIDERPLDGSVLSQLREDCVWVSPEVRIWNDSLSRNLGLEASPMDSNRLRSTLTATGLEELLERLPQGLATPLGEDGGLLSGGERQRIRIARGLLRDHPRLVLLDEASRGLDRDRRTALLERVRRQFAGATFVCVTHDIDFALTFSTVVVVEAGHVVEVGNPRMLAGSESRFASLIEADRRANEVWERSEWRLLSLDDGRLVRAADGATRR